MAVSLHHKSWGSMDDALNLEDDDDHHSEVADALLGFFSDPSDASHLPLDSLFDSPTPTPAAAAAAADPSFDNHIFLSTTHASFSAPSSMLSTPPDLYAPIDDFRHLYHCWKRPRSCSDVYPPPSSDFSLDADDSFNAPARAAGAGNRLQAPEPSAASASDWERKAAGGRCLSAQSVAARARRKRISDKTQELGRLIPGGNKMSTAEMFQAAFKYVKFLQAQVGILSLMGSLQDRNEPREVEQRLQGLLGSMTVQEKLTGEGRCIVPEEAVNAMSKDGEVKSNPLIARELDRFIEQLHRSTGE